MELECDLSTITSEELLRKMWQQSEDASRKKEIRSQLYKLREARLRDLYQGDIMADNTVAGFGKDPLATSHGDALADQSFQSLKSKEIRDSLSPTEMRFQSMTLNNPNTTGWNVQSSKEVTPDGRGFRAETIATTDGVENLNGGIAEFKGRNEQRSSAHHQGDDKNFVKKAMESSNSHLQEKVVFGDENSGRTEVRTSSSTSTSSSQVFQSSTNVEYDDGFPVHQGHPQKYLMDSNLQQRHQQEQQRLLDEQRRYEQQFQQQRQQHHNQQEHRTTEQVSSTRQNTEQKNISQNVQTQETHEQNKRYVNMDKASPEYQQHVQYLMQQPGEIISNTVEYPKPNVKMITTVKRLPDGTIVRNKRYETEEVPSTPRTTNQTNQPRRDSQSQTPSRNYPTDSAPHSRPSGDMVDSGSVPRYVQNTHDENVEKQFSSVKKSSRKFSTETTSETIQEYDDRYPQGEPRAKPVTNDFSTHGFPSVRPNKPTQEYPTERPQSGRPAQGYPSSGPQTPSGPQYPSGPQQPSGSQYPVGNQHPSGPQYPSGAVVPHYPDAADNITERRINTKDGEVIIVSSEKKRNYKTSTNSERIVETEHVIRDDQPYQQIPDKGQDFSTHGFPSVREPSGNQQPKNYPSEKQMQPQDQQDFPLDKFSPGRRIIKHSSPHGDDDVIVVSAQKSRTAKHSTNTERVIQHEIIREDQPSGYPRTQPQTDNSPYNYTVTTPGDQVPQVEFPGSPRKPSNVDYTTQGFPSVKTPGQPGTPGDREPHYSTQGFPSVRTPGQPETPGDREPHYSTQGFPSVRTPGQPGTPGDREPHYSTQGFPSVRTPGQPGTPNDREPYDDYPEGKPKTPANDYSTQGYPSAKTPSRPAAGLPSSHGQHPNVPRKSPNQDYSTQGFPSVKTPSKDQPASVEPGRTNGTVEPSKTSTTTNKTQPRTPSPQKYKTPSNNVRETTERIIRKEKEVDSAHRAFAAMLRSSSPIEPVRRDSYTTDSHSRHTPRSSISSTKTFRRDMREGSHDSAAPSEVSRISTTTVTRSTPPRTVGGKTVVTRVVTTKSPSPSKSVTTTTTTTTRTVPKASEKSPTKKPSSQPAPTTSRSSTPSYNNRKPKPTTTTSAMTDDYDDADKFKQPTTSPSSSPTSRSRTPQKIYPNDKPQVDDWHTRPQPDNEDERRTVNRETTFDKEDKEPSQPRKPNYEQPNIEWVIVDDDVDHDDYDDDDNDSFVPEVVDSNTVVKRTTTKLITNEKQQSPLAPSRKPKPTTTTRTTTMTTKQLHTLPTKSQPKSIERSPLKIKPTDTKSPQRPLTDPKKLNQTPQKSSPKAVDKPQQPKGPRSTTPSYTSPLRKPSTKSTTEETTLRKTLKTSQVVKDKTTELIESEKPKRKPLTPDNKTKPKTPDYRKPGEETVVTVTEITRRVMPGDKTPYDTNDEPNQGRPGSKKPQSDVNEPDQHTPGYRQPKDSNYELIQGTPGYRKPQDDDYEPQDGYRKPQDNEPQQGSPGYTKPKGVYDEPIERIPGCRKLQDDSDEPQKGFPNQSRPSYRKPQDGDEPFESYPDDRRPHGVEPNSYRKPNETDKEPQDSLPSYKQPARLFDEPHQGTPEQLKPQRVFNEQIIVTETSENRYPGSKAPKRPDTKPIQGFPGLNEPYDTDEPNQGSPVFGEPKPDEKVPGSRKPFATDDKPQRPLTDSRKPKQTPQKSLPKADDKKHQQTKSPRNTTSSYPSSVRKPTTKSTTEETTLRKTSQIVKDKTTKLIESEKTKRKPLTPDSKTAPQTPGYKKPGEEMLVTVTDITEKRIPGDTTPKTPYDIDDEPNQGRPGYKRPQDGKPVDTDEEPNQGSPGYRKPHGDDFEPQDGTPGYRKPKGVCDEPIERVPGYRKPQDDSDEPQEGLPDFKKPERIYDEPNQNSATYRKPRDDNTNLLDDVRPHGIEPDQRTPGYRKTYGKDDEPKDGLPYYKQPQSPFDEPKQGSPVFGKPKTDEIVPGLRKPYETDDEPNQHTPGLRKPQQTGDEPLQGSPAFGKSEPNERTPGFKKPQDTDDEPKKGSPAFRKPPSPRFQRLQATFDERSPHYKKPQDSDSESQPRSPGYKKPQDSDDEPGFRKPQEPNGERPSYLMPQQIIEEQITITESSQSRYPGEDVPKHPGEKPYQGYPGYRKPVDTDGEPHEGSPYYRKPEGIYSEPYEGLPGTPGYRKPQDTSDEPQRGMPGYKMPKDADEPNQRVPEYSKPKEGSPSYKRPQHITEEQLIITQTTQKKYPESPFDTDKEPNQDKPRTPGQMEPLEDNVEPRYRKYPREQESTKPGDKHSEPFETDDEPYMGKPRTPGQIELLETDDEPSSLGYRKHSQKPQTKPKKPGDRPSEPEDDPEYISESDTTTRISQTTVAKHIHKFETNKSTKPQKVTKSPTKDQPKTPGKETSPTRKPGQKYPEETKEKMTKSPKNVSPTRTPKKPEDDERFTSKQVVTKKTTKPLNNKEYPQDKKPETQPKPRKPLDTNEDETVVETNKYIISSTQKRVVNEEEIDQIEEICYPNEKTPQKDTPTRSQKKPEELSGKRSTSPTKSVSPTRTQKKPDKKSPSEPRDKNHRSPTRTQKKPTLNDDETYTTSLTTTKIVRKHLTEEFDEDYPEDETKGRKPLSEKPSKTDETFVVTSEFVTNTTNKRGVSEEIITEFEEPELPDKKSSQGKPLRDSKSPTRGVSPTKGQKKPNQEPIGKLPQSPNKEVSPTRSPKKSDKNLPVDDQTFKKTLRTSETVTKKSRSNKTDKPEKIPKGLEPDSEQSSDTDEEELITETSEHIINTTQKRVVTEQNILELEESRYPDNKTPKSPARQDSPTRTHKKPGEQSPEEHMGKRPQSKSPSRGVSPQRKPGIQETEKPGEQLPEEPIGQSKSPSRGVSPQRKPGISEPENLTGKRPQSPNSSTLYDKKPKGVNMRPQSPTRTSMKPTEETPLDEDDTYTTTITTKIVKEKFIQEFDDEEYPKGKPKGRKPGESPSPTRKSTTQKSPSPTRKSPTQKSQEKPGIKESSGKLPQSPIKNVSPIREFGEFKEPTGQRPQSPTRKQPIQRKPDSDKPYDTDEQEIVEETTYITDRRPQSPTRTLIRPSEETPLDDVQTYTTSTTTTKIVKEKLIQEFDDEEYPKGKPKGRKPGESPSPARKSTTQKSPSPTRKSPIQKSQEKPDFKEPSGKLPHSPSKHVSPTREFGVKEPTGQRPQSPTRKQPIQSKPDIDKPYDTNEQKIVEETTYLITEKLVHGFDEPKSPNRADSPTRTKKSGQKLPEEPIGKRPQSPTRTPKKPTDEDEIFKTTVRTTKIVTGKTIKQVDDEEYPDKKSPIRKDDKPQTKPGSNKPYDTDEDETIEETTCIITEKVRKDSPTRSPKTTKKPEEKDHTGRRPESPIRTRKEVTKEDKTFKTTITEKTTKVLDDNDYPIGKRQKPKDRKSHSDKPTDTDEDDIIEETTIEVTEQITDDTQLPSRGASPTMTPKKPGQKLPDEPTGMRPKSPTFKKTNVKETITMDKKPKQRKPDSDKPYDTDDEETTYQVTEKITCELREPESPTRGVSPTRSPKKPGQKVPEKPEEKETSGKRPKSPTRSPKKPSNDDDTIRTTKTITKKTDNKVVHEEYPDERVPHKKGVKPETKPKQKIPHDIDEEEIIVTEENIVQEFEEPESLTRLVKQSGQKQPKEPKEKEPLNKRPLSPTRTPKKPFVEDETFKTSLRSTKTITEKTTKKVDDEEYPVERIPLKKGSKPKQRKPDSDKPDDTSEEEIIDETTSVITTKIIREFEEQQSPTRGVSPTRVMKKPSQKIPEPEEKQPVGKRPQSPSRTPKKPTDLDETYKTTLRTTKTVTTKSSKPDDDNDYPEEHEEKHPTGKRPSSPQRTSKKPSDLDETIKTTQRTTKTVTEKSNKTKPKIHKDKPDDTEEEEIIEETTHVVTEKIIREYDRPESPTRKLSPTRVLKKPGQKLPQEPQPTGKRPQSPDDSTFKTTLKTTKTVTTKTLEGEEYPDSKAPHKKPGEKSPQKPISKRPQSPSRSPKQPGEKITEDDTFDTSKIIRTTTTVTKVYEGEEYPGDKEPKQKEPSLIKPYETDEDRILRETSEYVIKTSQKPKYSDSQEPQENYPQEQPKYRKPGFEETTEFLRNTTQRLITTEQQTLETEKQILHPYDEKPSKESPKKERSPTGTPDSKETPKLLRTIEVEVQKTKPKQRKPGDRKPTDTDDDETNIETEEYVIETCEKHYVTVKPSENEPLDKPTSKEPLGNKPQDKHFTSTYVETTETIEGQTYPKDTEEFPETSKYPDNKKPSKFNEEPWLPKEAPKRPTNINEKFIETERMPKESPDGGFISKTTEPTTPTSPTYRKKGTSRSDTFEERCRQILGMDTYGDTPGTYKKPLQPEGEEPKKSTPEDLRVTEEEIVKNTAIFQVKIEDCDDDDEPLSINSVKKTLHKQTFDKEPMREVPKGPKSVVDQPGKHKEEKPGDKTKPKYPDYEDNEYVETVTKTTNINRKTPKTQPIEEEPEHKSTTKTKKPVDDENELIETVTKTTTIHKKTPKIKTKDGSEPDSSEPEEETFIEINKRTKKSEVKVIKKSSPTDSPRSISPTRETTSPRAVSPTKGKPAPLKETPKRKPSKETIEPKTTKTSPQKPIKETTSIKERLRSSTRKSPHKTDQVDASGDSSPEHSPTRYTEERRSSNISVTTEIIIEHTDSDTPSRKEKSPSPKKPKDSVFKDIIDSTVLPEKLTRRMPVTERKESAPVHRVTTKDKDTKMSRSTSENLIKVTKKLEPESLSPKTAPKSEHRRPTKCFATKTINLSATERLVHSQDMENVIIDIQHAKSSREPSPDKIVPTPVPAHLDTGKPRYPDVVQEPEDEQPKRKPQVKNIPIFEEESNTYVGCHITEVNVDRTHKTTYDSINYEVEAPASLDYPSLDKPSDEESLLSVHEKVTRYQNITEDLNKPYPRAQIIRGEPEEPITDEENEEFIRNERKYTTIKLQPSDPQKSPELVRTISRHISRQTEPDSNDELQQPEYNKDFVECLVTSKTKNLTKEFEVSHQTAETTTAEKTIKTKQQQPEKYQQPKDDNEIKRDYDDDELIPHTAMHTTIIEERRQKDILSRPSVFEGRNKKPSDTTPTTSTTTSKTPLKCNKSPVKDSEKLRPDNKSRTKPTSAAVTHTTTVESTNKTKPKQQQKPRKNSSDIDYNELRGSGSVETGVRNIISKQTKVYKNNNTTTKTTINESGSSKTNDLKNLTTTSNKKPEKKHTPVHLTPAKNSDEQDFSTDDDRNDEMIINVQHKLQIDEEETQVVSEDLNKETTTGRKIPLTTTTPQKPQPTHSSTYSSPTDQPLKTKPKSKEHVLNLTETKKPLKPNTTTTSSIKTYEEVTDEEESVERADDIDEIVLEPGKKKSTPHPSNKSPKMSTTTTDSVAARRSLFESNNSSPSATPTKRTPLTSPMTGRRPSYMDHTKSSLEHTRRDSMEINKTNYSRKPSQPDDENTAVDRNSMVKFEVSHGRRATTPRATSVTEDINVEEIWELEVLEKLLETVQSYEIRRRIRAQLRLIKKNQKNNDMISSTTEVTTKTIRTIKQGSEEPDTVTTTIRKTKPETKTPLTSTKKEYIFEETYLPSTRRSPKPNRYPYEEEKEPVRKPTRSQSPLQTVGTKDTEEDLVEEGEIVAKTIKQKYYYRDEHEEEEHMEKIVREISPSRKSVSPTRKPHSKTSSPERARQASPDTTERNRSPQTKNSPQQSSRVSSSRSPEPKSTTASTTIRKSSATYEQQEDVKTTSKPITKRITTTTVTTTKSKPEDKAPVWADRKNILKAPSATTPTPKPKTNTSSLDSRSGYTKTTKSSTTHKTSSFVDDDCVTSSYGIGPTDENGLPLFGIRALKKKKPTVEPSETTEEVTGYVVEEKYYSDSKSKPTVERKEFIYSTNPEELKKLKDQVEISPNRKALEDVDYKETRKSALISKGTPALRSSPEDDFLDSSSKYVRRGSVKEMSEKFIQREASSTVTEKANNYPKAGLILRTNSRKNSRDTDNDSENYETFKSTRIQQHHTTSMMADSDNEQEYEHEEDGSRHSGRFITESESECDSIKTQREFKKVTSTSSSKATRSFLNTQGDEKVITNVSDCLERMRNADYVVEEGDTAEDQEARALLNKFLGASIIMKGVESSLPGASAASTNRQSRIITTTTTSTTLSDDEDGGDNVVIIDGDNNAKHEVKTTRITKTIKSGSSSSPVTYTTCAIEEIWDEEILKELLEQAKTYEERRKIRSRLRELMADREEQKQQKSSTSTTQKTETKEKDGAVVTTTTKVTTRTITGSAAKPVSPFNKFKQLDKQNSQQSAKSPTTPTTPGGGSTASPTSGNQPMFKFTDPALNAKVTTVKEQLLQWCQSKTQEYENVEITNFSTSWNNGLAFCALIHHFLPDAFDYSQLTPKNRRKKFRISFHCG